MTFARPLLICSLILVGCGASQAAPSTPAPVPPASAAATPVSGPSAEVRATAQSIVAAADRSDADRALDAGRKPAELLSFFKVAPGMRVLDLAAGGGYTTELLARMVGDSGVVYGENPKVLLGFVEPIWTERLQRPAMKHVVRVDAELDAPWPAEVKDLDLVTLVLIYHDTVWQETDRAKMNANIFAALKPRKNQRLYKQRSYTVEPMQGLLKDIFALERCWRRGNENTRWVFAALGIAVQMHQ